MDSDGDGLPDEWEQLYFGNLDEGGFDDSEDDGLNNFGEYDRGLNPSESDFKLILRSFDRRQGTFRLAIEPVAGRNIGVEYSTDLTPGSWIELGNFFDVEGEGVFVDPDPTRHARPFGYYRAFLRPVIR